MTMAKRIKNKGRVIRVYISGKISGLPQDEVELKFKSAQHEVEQAGFMAVNPLDYNLEGYTYEQLCNDKEAYYKQLNKDLDVLRTCDVILLLPDWEDSNGAKIERQFAITNRLAIAWKVGDIIEALREQKDELVTEVSYAVQRATGIDRGTYSEPYGSIDNLYARMLFTHHIRQHGFSLHQIGKIINRDHSSVMYYLKKYNDERRYNKAFKELAEETEQILNTITP